MKLLERDNCFLIKDFFDDKIIAGFSKPVFSGNVEEDLPLILKELTKDFQIAFLHQIHSPIVHKINKPGRYEGDGLMTKKSGLVCVVRTADCLPVFLASKEQGTIGIVHMGWRGAKEGILDNINEDLSAFKALAGVGLRQCCYEVGKDFLTYNGFTEFLKERSGKFYFAPAGFAKKKLIAYGLKDDNFCDLDICSLCSDKDLFSYRRNATEKRTLSFILRQED